MDAGASDMGDIQVVRNFEALTPTSLDKHKILQILINVISNAKYAVSESTRRDKQITVRIGTDANRRVTIAVADNGIGIAQENLARIFAHGFTTKKDGHGFGLHSGALAAKEMGGCLTVHSEGLGHGATFTLELPAPAPAA